MLVKQIRVPIAADPVTLLLAACHATVPKSWTLLISQAIHANG